METNNIFSSNHERSEKLRVMSRFKKFPIFYDGITLADTSVKTKAGNFGVIMDKTLPCAEHFNEMCKKACFAKGLVILKSTFFSMD